MSAFRFASAVVNSSTASFTKFIDLRLKPYNLVATVAVVHGASL
jgi:hypothetical protein